jgi:hypothetical protein
MFVVAIVLGNDLQFKPVLAALPMTFASDCKLLVQLICPPDSAID